MTVKEMSLTSTKFTKKENEKEMKMNKSRLIGGIICLAIAGALTVANLRLPPEDLMFQVGDVNMPWVPPIVLGIVGIVLLAALWEQWANSH